MLIDKTVGPILSVLLSLGEQSLFLLISTLSPLPTLNIWLPRKDFSFFDKDGGGRSNSFYSVGTSIHWLQATDLDKESFRASTSLAT